MSVIETLTQRNEGFASSRFSADLKIMPSTARVEPNFKCALVVNTLRPPPRDACLILTTGFDTWRLVIVFLPYFFHKALLALHPRVDFGVEARVAKPPIERFRTVASCYMVLYRT
jgi:hypothetical protein